jgi:hypothetical protein
MEKSKITARIFEILASIFVIIGVIVSIYGYLPKFLIYLVTIFSISVLLWLLYAPISSCIEKMKRKRYHNILAKKHFKEFKNHVLDFKKFADYGSHFSIFTLIDKLNEIRDQVKFVPCPYNSSRYISLIHNGYVDFERKLQYFNGTKETFYLLVSLFENILRNYVSFIQDFFYLTKKTGTEDEDIFNLAPDFKMGYEKFKANYEHFLRNYNDFAKNANREFGEGVLVSYFEIPEGSN